MRRALALVVLLVALDASRVACAQATVTANRNAPLHSGPAASSPRVGTLDSGQTATLLSHRGRYDRVRLADSSTAWVYARYVTVDSTAVAPDSGQVTLEGAGQPTTISALPKPQPREANDPTCADIGEPNQPGSPVDTVTDLLKNRIDDGAYQEVGFADVLGLAWQNLPRKRYLWSAAQRQAVAHNEGAAISLVGYIVGGRAEGPEQTNCELPDADWHDWHIWLVQTEAEASARDRTKAVVVEVTPRVRQSSGSTFDLTQIQTWARNGQRVRVSGWLLLDPDHPDQVGKTRGTIWEIHPVMKIETTVGSR